MADSDIGVAILPGSDFGRQPEEFTARLAYVDFNGEKALKAAETYGDKPIDDDFLELNCKKVMQAIQIIGDWLIAL